MDLLTGFATTLSMIVAVGAQNAFVLRQGLRREYVVPVVVICSLSDALLISAGIAGLGALLTAAPTALTISRYAGALFLLAYAVIAARRAVRPVALTVTERGPAALRTVLLTCLGFTYLNPHVYLDTVVLLGSLANQRGPDGRWLFGLGAAVASCCWFAGIGFLARRLAPVFARPNAWRVLDGVIAVTMTALAVWMLVLPAHAGPVQR